MCVVRVVSGFSVVVFEVGSGKKVGGGPNGFVVATTPLSPAKKVTKRPGKLSSSTAAVQGQGKDLEIYAFVTQA